jgi:hypothetical protein
MSANGIEILRHRDLIWLVEPASLHEHAFACAEINRILVEPLEPGMLMPVGEKEE